MQRAFPIEDCMEKTAQIKELALEACLVVKDSIWESQTTLSICCQTSPSHCVLDELNFLLSVDFVTTKGHWLNNPVNGVVFPDKDSSHIKELLTTI